jgi:hypothetical protein
MCALCVMDDVVRVRNLCAFSLPTTWVGAVWLWDRRVTAHSVDTRSCALREGWS